MTRTLKANQVFKPFTYPEHTYIQRKNSENEAYEALLEEAIETPGLLISITGPSKSGKTVLCSRVIGFDRMIMLNGSDIKTSNDFWNILVEKMELPSEIENTESIGQEVQGAIEGSGEVGFKLISKAAAKLSGSRKGTSQRAQKEKRLTGKERILQEMIDSDLVLVIDDFHYIPPEIQLYLSRQLKDAIFRELKAVILSLPHRADDAVRLNPDLIGRLELIDIEPWSDEELALIASAGFPLLDLEVPEDRLQTLVKESIGSPQLMQYNCLNVALVLGVDRNPVVQRVNDLTPLQQAFRKTARNFQYDAVIEKLLFGPTSRGKARTSFELRNNKQVDIYGLILSAIKEDPPLVSIRYEEIKRRIETIMKPSGSLPTRLQISNALDKLQDLIKRSEPLYHVIEWKDQKLHILDSYFLFSLRWSDRAPL